MSLSKEDRIAFSKKIIEADAKKSAIDASKQAIQSEKDKAYDLDQANKRLVDTKTALIDPYQVELGRYSGIFRISLTESDINNSANFVLGNYLYPNDPQNPPPSTAPQVWTKTKPFARTAAVGKMLNESYPAALVTEQSMISTILSTIDTIETNYTLIQRVTGQFCTPSTPPAPNIIATYPALNSSYDILLSTVNSLKTYVASTQPLILTSDPDSARQAQNNLAISNIDIIISALDVWLALAPFNTAHGQTTCTGFNSYNAALLGPTRLQSGDLTALKNAALSRQAFLTTRISEIENNLGYITQDLSTASTTGAGLYYERWAFLQLRLNIFGGSLIALNGFDRTLEAQESQKEHIDLSKNTYLTLIRASLLSAPSNGTKILHLKSALDFSAGNSVYLVSDAQEELSLQVQAIEGNRLTVNIEIPAKYRPSENARIYKDIS